MAWEQGAIDDEDMQPPTQRSLIQWAKALCLRAALADASAVSASRRCSHDLS